MRRAGTHFIRDTITNNFNVKWANAKILHPVPDASVMRYMNDRYTTILIVRHPVDNLKSLYRFLKQSKEVGHFRDIENKSFSDFINGKVEYNVHMRDRWMKHCLEDPIGYWLDNSYLADFCSYMVKYEDLNNNFITTMQELNNFLKCSNTKFVKPSIRTSPVGIGPQVEWSEADLTTLYDRVGYRLKQLNYGE